MQFNFFYSKHKKCWSNIGLVVLFNIKSVDSHSGSFTCRSILDSGVILSAVIAW